MAGRPCTALDPRQGRVRTFYEMTRSYIADLLGNTERWHSAWEAEVRVGVVDRLTTIECDLASIEAPMHCDVCKKTISAVHLPGRLIGADRQPEARAAASG